MSRTTKPSLFNGYWTDTTGKKIRRIWKREYPELYRLHRLCVEYEKQGFAGGGSLLAVRPHQARTGVPLPERNPFHEVGGLARTTL